MTSPAIPAVKPEDVGIEIACPDASEDVRKSAFASAPKVNGQSKDPDFMPMSHVTSRIHARFWGVSKAQLKDFVEGVRHAVSSGGIINPSKNKAGQFYYPQDKFESKDIGPNMHIVNGQFIKPRTKEADLIYGIPFLSYALMKNSATAGLACDLFVSHAWDEGCYQFGNFALEKWPAGLQGAYICFLSNPQHNPSLISELCKTPTTSPFYRVLAEKPSAKQMMMLPNSNTPIHNRLWCVYEAFVAEEKAIPTFIAGDKQLLTGNKDAIDAYKRVEEEMKELKESPRPCCDLFGVWRKNKEEKETRLRAARKTCKDQLINVKKARCSNAKDKKSIEAEIKGSEGAVDEFIRGFLISATGLEAADFIIASEFGEFDFDDDEEDDGVDGRADEGDDIGANGDSGVHGEGGGGSGGDGDGDIPTRDEAGGGRGGGAVGGARARGPQDGGEAWRFCE